MKTFNILPKSLRRLPNHKYMAHGICNRVSSDVLDFICTHVHVEWMGIKITPERSVEEKLEVGITPKYAGWTFGHFCQVIQCKDGKVVFDVPMQEYARVEDGKFYTDPSPEADYTLYAARNANDLQIMWGCRWSEAVDIAKGIQKTDWPNKFAGTVEELFVSLDK
jgi:hypothetical protein